MKIRKHFRLSESDIDLILSDFTLNRITNREVYMNYCVENRIHKLSNKYNEKIDKILSFIIIRCGFDNLPLEIISRIIYSLTKVTSTLSKGLLFMVNK